MRRYLIGVLAAVLVVASVVVIGTLGTRPAAAATPCDFAKAQQPARVAFCDTFDKAAAPNSSRSGALDPTVWGVSRIQADDTSNSAVDPVVPATGYNGQTVDGDNDVYIQNGQLFDTMNDDGGQSILAMYPRQPFDVAGREGDVTFDVSNNSEGPHSAWPSFVYTDQPVPAPYSAASGEVPSPQNSFGFALDYEWENNGQWLPNESCSDGGHTIGEVWETIGGKLYDYAPTGANASVQTQFGTWNDLACVNGSSSPTDLSHFEVQIGNQGIFVWATQPGSSSLIELASCAGCSVPLTRGLIWMEDDHYNGDKFNDERTDTFGWDNVGFDGPTLPRDLALEVPDHNSTDYGWADGSTVTTLPGTAAEIHAASGALVEMNWYAVSAAAPTVSVNGHPAVSGTWDFGDQSYVAGYGPTYVWRTIAIPIPLSDLVAGANQITVTNAGQGFANVDIILQGAGGVPTCLDPSDCGATTPVSTGTPVPTPAPSASPTPTPSPSATPTPAPSPSPSSTPTPTPTQTATPAPGHHRARGHHRHHHGHWVRFFHHVVRALSVARRRQ